MGDWCLKVREKENEDLDAKDKVCSFTICLDLTCVLPAGRILAEEVSRLVHRPWSAPKPTLHPGLKRTPGQASSTSIS